MRTYSRIFPRAWLRPFTQVSSSDAAKTPLWRAVSEFCQPYPHGALVCPRFIHSESSTTSNGWVGENCKEPEAVATIELLRCLGKPPMWRAVFCILYIVSTPGVACCLIPSIQDLSLRQRDEWELRERQSGWTPSSQSPIPNHLPCQTDEWELLGMRSALYITVW